MDDLDLALRRRPCLQDFWINEFSKLGFEKMRLRSIKQQLLQSERRRVTKNTDDGHTKNNSH